MKVIHKISDNTYLEFNEDEVKNYTGYGRIGWLGWLMISILFGCIFYAFIKTLFTYYI